MATLSLSDDILAQRASPDFEAQPR
ncbi:hypothetical protein A2U01_0097768, partial [Trifolium medium]|nr:hypothetical protein [Trifolium medium]